MRDSCNLTFRTNGTKIETAKKQACKWDEDEVGFLPRDFEQKGKRERGGEEVVLTVERGERDKRKEPRFRCEITQRAHPGEITPT